MPWDCLSCGTNYTDDVPLCSNSACAQPQGKSAWTLHTSATRTFVLRTPQLEVLRGVSSDPAPATCWALEDRELVETEVARPLPKESVAALFRQGQRPAPLDLLFVRLYPASRQQTLDVSVELAQQEPRETTHALQLTGYYERRLVCVYGDEPAGWGEVEFEQLEILDLSDPDEESGCATDLELRVAKKHKELGVELAEVEASLSALRGEESRSHPRERPVEVELASTEVAPVMKRSAARRLAQRGHVPGSKATVHARVASPPAGEWELVVGLELRSGRQEQRIPSSRGRALSGGEVEFPLLFVRGPERSEDADLDLGGAVLVGAGEHEDQFAPRVELSLAGQRALPLATEALDVTPSPTRAIPGGCFAYDSTFPTPGVAQFLIGAYLALEEDEQLSLGIFGHTDKAGSDSYNKDLSDRRAEAVRAMLTDDLSSFDALAESEDWGLDVYQAMLRTLGCNPGAIDGTPGDMTSQAVRAFRESYNEDLFHDEGHQRERARGDLPEGDELDAATKAALRDAYLSELSTSIEPGRLRGPAAERGGPIAGCSEFNRLHERDADNRRVTLALFGADAPEASEFPCQAGDAGACTLDQGPGTHLRCSFYRDRVAEEPETGEDEIPFYDFEWLRTPSGKFHLSAVTRLGQSDDLRFTIHRWQDEGPPREADSSEGGEPPQLGDEVGQAKGLIRLGVAYALWDAGGAGFDPSDLSTWFDDEGRWSPPVFRIEDPRSGAWAVSSPPGWRGDGARLEGAPQGKLLAVESSGRLVVLGGEAALKGLKESRLVHLRLPGTRLELEGAE